MGKLRWAACVAGALLCASALAETHALIMTIGEYRDGVPPLLGVRHDAESARTIARRMGVKDANIRHLSNDQLTHEGMVRAFDELYERVAENDQVFVYYSGHGSRQRVREPEERCAEALVTIDNRGFTDAELEAQLKRLSTKAQKLVVFLDACHSGGVATRSADAPGALFRPKFASRAGGDACSKPSNVLTRSLRTRSIGRGVDNYVYIAAARDNEVSLDQPAKGGVATQAWRDCMGTARDADGSGGLSAEEIASCAQARINATLKNVKGFTPHHVSVSGNRNAVLAFAERAAPPQAAKPAPVKVASQPPAYYTLQDIYSNRDDRRVVTLQGSLPAFRINKDFVEFTLTSTHAGHVYILMVGSDGKSFDMLFPNKLDAANSIAAGETLRLPRPSWEVRAAGPAGKNHVLAIVTDSPRDFTRLGMQPAGPFSMVSASPASSKDIQLVTTSAPAAATPECASAPGKRALVVQQRCSSAYGAAMMVLEEVE
ncbi:MAG TPA: caspase family protein [Burkholderiales bacterium]|nr:caspase family protein [Burkholderiales bacterium]